MCWSQVRAAPLGGGASLIRAAAIGEPTCWGTWWLGVRNWMRNRSGLRNCLMPDMAEVVALRCAGILVFGHG